ncbi:MAG: hypothetical protein HUK22_07785 [Thermoguttaceae bacterium]|nr:hypothetical protein [Thermoguttaceae bacterium]
MAFSREFAGVCGATPVGVCGLTFICGAELGFAPACAVGLAALDVV